MTNIIKLKGNKKITIPNMFDENVKFFIDRKGLQVCSYDISSYICIPAFKVDVRFYVENDFRISSFFSNEDENTDDVIFFKYKDLCEENFLGRLMESGYYRINMIPHVVDTLGIYIQSYLELEKSKGD